MVQFEGAGVLRVTVEIVPFGDEAEKRTIATMNISRMKAIGNPCDYKVRVDKPEREFEVVAHQYEDGAWALVAKAVDILQSIEVYEQYSRRTASNQT